MSISYCIQTHEPEAVAFLTDQSVSMVPQNYVQFEPLNRDELLAAASEHDGSGFYRS